MVSESPSRWLSASVRTLFRRIEKLEDLLVARTFRFNPEAPEFVPKSSLCLDDLIQPTSICNAEFANLIYNLYLENQPRSMHAENPNFTDKYSRAENPEIIQNTIQCRGDAADEERDSMGYDANEQDAADINTARPNMTCAAPSTTFAAPAPVTYSAPATTYAAPAPVTYAAPQQLEDPRVARLADLIRRRRDAAPQTYAAPQVLPTAASMVAVPQQYQFAPQPQMVVQPQPVPATDDEFYEFDDLLSRAVFDGDDLSSPDIFGALVVSNDDDECSSSSCTSEGMPDLIPADGNGCEDDAEQYDYDSDSDSEVERMEHYLMSINAWDDDEQYVDEQYDCDSVAYEERENHLRSTNR